MLTPTGNPLYKAPEINLGIPYDEKVDIWSLMIVLKEILPERKSLFFSFNNNKEKLNLFEKFEINCL